MQAIINPSYFNGNLKAPASKSYSQRAFAAALLHVGKTEILNAGSSNDEIAALNIIINLGATILYNNNNNNKILIESLGVLPISDSFNCAESGLCSRLFTPIAAISNQLISINAEGSLLKRKMVGFDSVFKQLEIEIKDFNGYLPLQINGPLIAKNISVDAQNGSQFLSGLLFALSNVALEPINIFVKELKSKPYIDLTLEVLEKIGILITHDNYKKFYINPLNFKKPEDPVKLNVEGDWSSAAYMLVAAALTGRATIENLNLNSVQADKAILNILKDCGALIKVEKESITVSKAPLRNFTFDATDCPDLFPVLSILAAGISGMSSINGLHRLLDKESNRIISICAMLNSFDVPFLLKDDTLQITGGGIIKNCAIDTFNDHRITMAASIGAIMANGKVIINNIESVKKSYTGFFTDLIASNIKCEIV